MIDRQSQTERPTEFLPAAADPERRHPSPTPANSGSPPPEAPSTSPSRGPYVMSSPMTSPSTREKMQVSMTPTRAERPTGWLSGSGGRQRRSWRPKHPEDMMMDDDQASSGNEDSSSDKSTSKLISIPNLDGTSSHHHD
eukprot:CAMPEP_0119566078 /NCGR_PEP_ID=MMETSP1352-20130426/32014_1 /TAXON_ID=265584 /ORGANISM="Stauroneis constricta, Strain CCMP1120" /LENGTH=138 /DNA_ID=CAMNT_0007615125 /DNA_START=86 /DNA_END=502 /DNA_ORIENTATION=+